VRYNIKGSDQDSEFEAQRRYKDFFALHAVLVIKWPGCYIPSIPPKKKIGNKETWFIEQRREFLDAFLSQLVLIDAVYASEEFQ
jgi:hypothetical protein